MIARPPRHNKTAATLVAAVLLGCLLPTGAVRAQEAPAARLPALGAAPAPAARPEVEQLLAELARPDQPAWQQIEDSILQEWSRSGSPAMDLLLKRGQTALAAGDAQAAIGHLTALTDQAPDFAEGWNALATAYFYVGLYGPSLDSIRHTLALNPRHFGALAGLGFILDDLGYEAEALEAFQAVEAIHPHRPEVREAVERLEKSVEGERL